MILKREGTVLDFRQTSEEKGAGILTGQYAHVVDGKVYWQCKSPDKMLYATEMQGVFHKPEQNSFLEGSLACHNFVAFKDSREGVPKEELYKAIGGYHVGRASIKGEPTQSNILSSPLHGELSNCSMSKSLEVVPTSDNLWPQETRLSFKDDFCHPKHANGFYIFKSHDGIEWSLYHDRPVISGFTSGENGIPVACDSMPSIFFDNNIGEYVAYLRCNVKLGVRHVFYTRSKDLINWEVPKLITKSPEFDVEHENLYYMCAYPFLSDKYISFTPHFKNYVNPSNNNDRKYYDGKTLVMTSLNGVDWKVIDEIFIEEATGHMTQPHVLSFKEEEGSYCIYVHENFISYKNKLVKYTIAKSELDLLVKEAFV